MTLATLSSLAHERDLLKAALKDTVERADVSLRTIIEQRDKFKAINACLLAALGQAATAFESARPYVENTETRRFLLANAEFARKAIAKAQPAAPK